MKITKLETFIVPPRWCFLKIETDEGIVGWGEPVVEGRAHTVAAAVDELADYLIGKDPLLIEDHWQVMYRAGFYRGGPITMSAIAGVDQALWDIKGKHHGVPVHALLGGQVRDRIKVYSWIGGDRPSDVGLPLYGETAVAPPPAAGAGLGSLLLSPLVVFKDAARTPIFWVLFGTFFVCGASTNGLIQTHFVTLCHDYGLPAVTAASVLAMMGIFDFIGTIGSGWLSDRFGRRTLLAVNIALFSLLMPVVALAPTFLVFVIGRSIVGFALSGEWSLGSMLVAETWPARLRGLVLSVYRSAWGVGAALAVVLELEHRIAFQVRHACKRAAGGIATAAFDLDHLGAPVAQHRRGAGAGDVGGELDDLQPFQHARLLRYGVGAILAEVGPRREAPAGIPSG